jgi:hypothetical protein
MPTNRGARSDAAFSFGRQKKTASGFSRLFEKPALTQNGKSHILAASRINPRGWGRIRDLAGGEVSAAREAVDRRMEVAARFGYIGSPDFAAP